MFSEWALPWRHPFTYAHYRRPLPVSSRDSYSQRSIACDGGGHVPILSRVRSALPNVLFDVRAQAGFVGPYYLVLCRSDGRPRISSPVWRRANYCHGLLRRRLKRRNFDALARIQCLRPRPMRDALIVLRHDLLVGLSKAAVAEIHDGLCRGVR
jgi:hypothetical protein